MERTFGIVSDTHGHFDPLLRSLFSGVEAVLHAGDVCAEEVLEELTAIAPVQAISGNCDRALSTGRLPDTRVVKLGSVSAFLVHDSGNPKAPYRYILEAAQQEQARLVISGHSHDARFTVHDGILFLNPGSAGPKRFKLIRSAALLTVSQDRIEARVYSLETATPTLLFEESMPL